MNTYYVYILTNNHNTVFYIGVTNNLERRIFEHKNELIKGFSQKYQTKKLVWYEETNDINEALNFEKKLKKWKREWKLNIIKEINPDIKDLAIDWN